MFRSYLDNNYFVYLLRLAYEDGFMTQSRKDGPAWGGSDFGRIAAMCAPASMPRTMQRNSISPLLIDNEDNEDLIDKSLRKDLPKSIELEAVISDAWTKGQQDRWAKCSFVPGCSIENLKEFINDGPDPKLVKKSSERYALSVADKFPIFVSGGDVQTKWGLTPAGAFDGSCVLGWYYGEELNEGDYVEWAKGHVAIIGKVDREGRRAQALKLNSIHDTLTPVMGQSDSEHYSWWETNVINGARRAANAGKPGVGQRSERQSENFLNNLKDKITKGKPIASCCDKLAEEELRPIDKVCETVEDLKEAIDLDQGVEKCVEAVSDAIDRMETESGGVIMSEAPIDIDAAKAAAAKKEEAPPEFSVTFQNNPARTYTSSEGTTTITTNIPAADAEEAQQKQLWLQLHDKQVLSSKGLCERLGLDFDKEIENMRREGVLQEKRPAPKKKIKKPKALKKIRARKKKK